MRTNTYMHVVTHNVLQYRKQWMVAAIAKHLDVDGCGPAGLVCQSIQLCIAIYNIQPYLQ